MKSAQASFPLLLAFFFGGVGSATSVFAVNFEENVFPIFQSKCFRCHGDGESKGGFSLDKENISNHIGRSRQISPGRAERSVLVELLTTDNLDDRMPKNRAPLSVAEIDVIKKWIQDGASLEMAEADSEPETESDGPAPLKGSWTNTQGATIQATLVGVKDGKALLNTGAKVYEYPIEQLSQESQDAIAEWVKSGEKEDGEAPASE